MIAKHKNKNILAKWQRLFLLLISNVFFYYYSCGIFIAEKARYDYDLMDATTARIHKKIERFLQECIVNGEPVKLLPYTRIDSVVVHEEMEHIDVYFNRYFSFIPFREENTKALYQAVEDELGWWDDNYSVSMYTTNQLVEELVPNFYRSDPNLWDYSRLAKKRQDKPPLVRRISHPWTPTKGLFGHHVALWHSHGWYYESSLDRWEWQRARLFQSVEDLGPLSFILPYVVPMLENAGASVFLPRERDTQVNEVIVDNDSYINNNPAYVEKILSGKNQWQSGTKPGFAIGYPPYGDWINPFRQGSYRMITSTTEKTAEISWIPEIPQKGKYAVYVSYAHSDSSVTDAHYTVYHSGGYTEFLVNQTMGGHTWIYLGEYVFLEGINPSTGGIVLSNKSRETGKIVTADAVRFGGGMGNIIRGEQISGRPRYMEGARYYLQYAGMPDTLVYTLSGNKNDYTDDYQSRGEWVNYLIGAPFGPNGNRSEAGLGIPVDASLAFHTDAGITQNDTVIGTLSIYSTYDADSLLFFPDSVSRFANRDFADILQTQIVDDIRAFYDPVWCRRGLWDRGYSEAFRPNVPAVLLELLSHQNFLDMKFFMDPGFRFAASRSIYKAVLKFLATQHGLNWVVQPLPVTHLSAVFKDKENVLIRWQPNNDPIEASANPDKYIVYTRIGSGGFDNGRLTNRNEMLLEKLGPDTIYSFKITAVNDGGESFPSEILSVCRKENQNPPVLIINGFDRIAAPAVVESESFKGFANFIDAGVADGYSLDYTGQQFNFDPGSKWTDDDSPGFGSSSANMEKYSIPGNTHDFVYIHGQAISENGRSFISVSDEAVMSGAVNLIDFDYIDLILGEEKKTHGQKYKNKVRYETFPDTLQLKLTAFCENGGSLFVSGAHIGSDLFETPPLDTTDIQFAREILRFRFRTHHASVDGHVHATDSLFKSVLPAFIFNTDYHPDIYAAEAVDGIEPASKVGSRVVLRYSENNISAGVTFAGSYKVVAFGFPFETISSIEDRQKVMQAVLRYLDSE